jgi:uncharacterized membrane protein
MTQDSKDSNDYDLKPAEVKPPTTPAAPPPGFVPPVPIIEGPDDEETPEEKDRREHRSVAMAAYIFFLIPVLVAPKSRFARFHANQALTVFLAAALWMMVLCVYSVVTAFGPTIEALWLPLAMVKMVYWLVMVCWFFGLAGLIVKGVINAADSQEEPLPVIGGIRLLQDPDKRAKAKPAAATPPAAAPAAGAASGGPSAPPTQDQSK